MDDDGLSLCDSPGDLADLSMDQQKATLQSYIDSSPYECESQDVMQARLEVIVGKIYICAKSQNWLVLTTWDGMLQCWLLMRYPMLKTTRAKLVRLYYELCITPGIEVRVIRSWADMLNRLISNKSGMKRKLELEDLQLPWEPLWEALKTHLWHKGKVNESSRALITLLLYVAEQSNRYFARDEILNMLNAFIPLLTRETYAVMIPVITSFLPPSHTNLYLPALFKIWEGFNSSLIDDRFLHLAGHLSEEHVSGLSGDAGEGGAKWKDVGIWCETEWDILVSKGLGSMNVPIGQSRGASTTANHADGLGDRYGYKVKKTVDRFHSLAKIIVYSISVDGPVRQSAKQISRESPLPPGYIGGSRALDSLGRLITSTESFFHPSNSGAWTVALTTFLHRVVAEFAKRIKQEEKPDCKTPITHRITPAIVRELVNILKTPSLLALFSKDPLCVGFAQGALRGMATLQPSLIMPDLLERAYGGLEVVNETHRTTSVLSMLSGIARPLVTETVWLGGQKHLLPLLELSLPGIDLNDPSKTVCTTMFIVSAIQHVKIGDVSMHQSGVPLTDDIPDEGRMQVDDDTRLPDGTETPTPMLSRADERALARDSTAAFADWVAALFRRVIALYENLPEEGGRRNTTGGKQEESVLKSIKAMMDVVCLHMSDQLFDLILNMAFDYASTNSKSNAVRAFGQFVACLARVRPEQTLAKFLPFCMAQVEEELLHGASSIRTTAPTAAVPSDTTFHWNLAILRGCLGYGGPLILKYKNQILHLLHILVEKSKSERGYSGTGRLIGRILHTLVGIYPINSRFVNSDEWASKEFEQDHNLHWGRLYTAQDVTVEWHVPSDSEIAFVLEILDELHTPLLNKVEELVTRTESWNSSDRNDFCRYLNTCRSMWGGLSTFIQDLPKEVDNACINEETELSDLLVSCLPMNAGFVLNPSDPRYVKASAHRIRFGVVSRHAATTLRQQTEGEDHIDAVINVVKAMDTFLLDYGIGKESFESVQKSYVQARDTARIWNGQKENTRSTFVKRAQMYHCSRVYMHALYRRRSRLDDELIQEILELSLSPYTRVRRQSQAVLHNIFGYYVRSTRFALPSLFDALERGSDPDRMKGALYILWNKGIASYALSDQSAHSRYLVSLLECQHEEKPSIQKLVNSLASDCVPYLHEDAIHTDAYDLATPRVDEAIRDLESEFTASFVNRNLLQEAIDKTYRRISNRNELYSRTISSILGIVSSSQTHWRYVQMACRFLVSLMRRDTPVPEEVAQFLLRHSTSAQPTIAAEAQRGITRLLKFVNVRTFSASTSDLWLHGWINPLAQDVVVPSPSAFIELLQRPVTDEFSSPYVDKIRTGYIAWSPTVKGYKAVTNDSEPFVWDKKSSASLNAIGSGIKSENYFKDMLALWSQESSRTGTLELRSDHVAFIKRLAKMYPYEVLAPIFENMESLLSDSDKYKQRAGGEVLTGLVRGCKHWTKTSSEKLWAWIRSRLDIIFAEIKPETLTFWETAIGHMLEDRDPRRNQPLVDWIFSLSLDFSGDSAFQMSKALSTLATLVDSADRALGRKADTYIDSFLANANTNYAEGNACHNSEDPLLIRQTPYRERISKIMGELAQSREQRLLPPWSNKSEYDKVALTLLQWMWVSSYSPNAPAALPYMVDLMPEIFRMIEFNDNTELQTYSTAVLYVLSAFTPPTEYIPIILNNFVSAIKSATSYRIRLRALPSLVVFFYRNLLSIKPDGVNNVMEMLLTCLSDENVEVRMKASEALSGIVRCSQRQSIIQLKNRFASTIRKAKIPSRKDPTYGESLRKLHSAILGLCALIDSFPYSVEPWMPALTEVSRRMLQIQFLSLLRSENVLLISRRLTRQVLELPCHKPLRDSSQDTWHKDQLAFDEDQLQSLSTMLIGTSYYA
ncbi:armadillo-type protein [Mucidula mucida]|nr:armadillo-type protein [Mucidula mucida]